MRSFIFLVLAFFSIALFVACAEDDAETTQEVQDDAGLVADDVDDGDITLNPDAPPLGEGPEIPCLTTADAGSAASDSDTTERLCLPISH